MARNRLVILSVIAAATWCGSSAAVNAASPSRSAMGGARGIATEFSSQDRLAPRRARTRIEVRPLRGPMHRECVSVFEQRWIPQWGGNVLYANQRCWWAPGHVDDVAPRYSW